MLPPTGLLWLLTNETCLCFNFVKLLMIIVCWIWPEDSPYFILLLMCQMTILIPPWLRPSRKLSWGPWNKHPGCINYVVCEDVINIIYAEIVKGFVNMKGSLFKQYPIWLCTFPTRNASIKRRKTNPLFQENGEVVTGLLITLHVK